VLRTFKLVIAYDGTDYVGWQVQLDQPSVQGVLERALSQLTGTRIAVTGSGRTDSGVHALAQVGSLTTDAWRATATDLMRAINTKLPRDVVVTEAFEMPLGFHAIRDAVGKRYRYQLQIGGVRDAFDYRYRVHVPGRVDVQAMQTAAVRLIGKHDFASFQATGSERKTTVRHIRDLVVETEQGRGGALNLAIEIEADGFLYNMVRNIVGTLLEIGRGKQPPEWIDHLIAARDRDQAGPTAPPQGLSLIRVDYDIQPL